MKIYQNWSDQIFNTLWMPVVMDPQFGNKHLMELCQWSRLIFFHILKDSHAFVKKQHQTTVKFKHVLTFISSNSFCFVTIVYSYIVYVVIPKLSAIVSFSLSQSLPNDWFLILLHITQRQKFTFPTLNCASCAGFDSRTHFGMRINN